MVGKLDKWNGKQYDKLYVKCNFNIVEWSYNTENKQTVQDERAGIFHATIIDTLASGKYLGFQLTKFMNLKYEDKWPLQNSKLKNTIINDYIYTWPLSGIVDDCDECFVVIGPVDPKEVSSIAKLHPDICVSDNTLEWERRAGFGYE